MDETLLEISFADLVDIFDGFVVHVYILSYESQQHLDKEDCFEAKLNNVVKFDVFDRIVNHLDVAKVRLR